MFWVAELQLANEMRLMTRAAPYFHLYIIVGVLWLSDRGDRDVKGDIPKVFLAFK